MQLPTRDTRTGQIIILLALAGVLIFGLAALSVDIVYLYVVRSRLVTSVDAAALAAARALARGDTPAQQQQEANDLVDLLMTANFPTNRLMTQSVTHVDPVIAPGPNPGTRQVTVGATAVAPTFFMRILGWDTVPVNASATAIRRDVNLMLVLDRSGSMGRAPGSTPGPTAFDDLQSS